MSQDVGSRPAPGPNTLGHVLRLSTDHLAAKGSETPRLDAELLLSHATGLERIELYMAFDRPLSTVELERRGSWWAGARGGSHSSTSSGSGGSVAPCSRSIGGR